MPMSSLSFNSPEDDFNLYLEKAVEASRAAGGILMNYLDRKIKIEFKGRIDLVTEADKKAEDCILKILQEVFPDHGFLAEESGNQKIDENRHMWVIDPLDGTTNYAHGYRCFSVSIALLVDGIRTVGVVYDPWGKELFTAIRDKGAFLNNKPISVSEEIDLEKSLLVTGFPYDIREGHVTNLGLFNHLILKAQAVRRDGSAALDLAYVAAGRFDGLWELKLHPWDVAAGTLIVEEAGGKVTTFSGKQFEITSLDLLATNGSIHRKLMQKISEIPPESW